MSIVSFPIGSRRFAPSVPLSALTVLLCVVFVRLGDWQWDRGVHRQVEWDAFAHGSDAPRALGATPAAELPRYTHVSVAGRLDGAHQFLLDNRSHAGLPGYEVLTPLTMEDGRILLVDRGWVPFSGSRARLPSIDVAQSAVLTLTGRLDNLPVGGLALGHAAPSQDASWPKVTSFPTFPELAAALHERVEPWMLLLDPSSSAGYARDWQPPGLSPVRHFSYAVQWWGFAVTLLVIWGITSTRREARVPS